MAKTVVILVDNKKRDLPGAALVAHHLETRFHLKCVLQPLESWRSCLAAFKPNYILFNHLTASHLAYFSIRLRDMGILVGVLPNEGINYNQDDLEFNAGRYHSYAHIDQFFCWNEFHKKALMTIMNLN
jgi:surface carbohydrate biosynthesis protein